MNDRSIRSSEVAGPTLGEVRPLSEDLLKGADEIAEFFYGDRRQRRKIYHLAETSRLPVFRLGAVLCARKSQLMAWIEAQERASVATGCAEVG
jgi:hypothetical protein